MVQRQASVRSVLLVLAALVIVALPLAGGRVSAVTSDGDTSTSSDDAPVVTTSSVDDSGDGSGVSARVQERINAAKQKAQSQVESARKNVQTQSQEKRKQLCENRKNAIDNKLNAFTAAADKHLARLDGVYTKLKGYQANRNLTVSNYDTLIATANAEQQAAIDAVAALKSVSGGIDCSNADVSVQLKTAKEAGATARNALKEYRSSLHDILVALAQATKAAVQEKTGGNE